MKEASVSQSLPKLVDLCLLIEHVADQSFRCMKQGWAYPMCVDRPGLDVIEGETPSSHNRPRQAMTPFQIDEITQELEYTAMD